MPDSARLHLPFVAAAQAQKHITVNEALARVDAMVQVTAESRTLQSPPLVVSEGETYLIPAGGVNDWQDHDGEVTSFLNGAWAFFQPLPGWEIWVSDEFRRLTFTGDTWIDNAVALSKNQAAMHADIVEIDHVFTGGTFEQTGFVIPSHTSVWGVTGRVLQPITGDLSDWSLGVDGSATRYGDGLGLGAGSWLRGLTGQPVTYYSASRLDLTANGGSFTGGSVRLAIHLMRFDLPLGD